jgi:hypothetical protein
MYAKETEEQKIEVKNKLLNKNKEQRKTVVSQDCEALRQLE